MASDNHNPTVFSTEFGRMCPNCGNPLKNCVCKKAENNPPRKHVDGIVRLFIDRKGRGGKSVTIIDGLPFSLDQLKRTDKIDQTAMWNRWGNKRGKNRNTGRCTRFDTANAPKNGIDCKESRRIIKYSNYFWRNKCKIA